MVGLRIDRHRAAGTVDGEAGLQCRDHVIAVRAARPAHRFGPQHHALVVRDRDLVDGRGVAVGLRPPLLERVVLGRVQLLTVVVGDHDSVAFLGGEHLVFVSHSQRRRGERNLVLHSRRGPLPEERQVRAAHQGRDHEVRPHGLDLCDGGAEVGDVEGEKVDRGALAAVVGDVFPDPLGGDLAVVVVGGQDVDPLAGPTHREGDQRLDLLGGGDAVDEDVAVADPALVEHVVEVEGIGLAQGLADRLARGGENAAVHHVDLVLAHELLGVLRVERHVGLRVVAEDLDLLAVQAPARVDLLHREAHRHVHRRPVGVEDPGSVEDRAKLDGIGGQGRARQCRGAGEGARTGHEFTSVQGHLGSPVGHLSLSVLLLIRFA